MNLLTSTATSACCAQRSRAQGAAAVLEVGSRPRRTRAAHRFALIGAPASPAPNFDWSDPVAPALPAALQPRRVAGLDFPRTAVSTARTVRVQASRFRSLEEWVDATARSACLASFQVTASRLSRTFSRHSSEWRDEHSLRRPHASGRHQCRGRTRASQRNSWFSDSIGGVPDHT